MSDNNAFKGKYLRMEDRLIIEYGLDENYTLKEIAVKELYIIILIKMLLPPEISIYLEK